jgi:hypothetical protein
MRRLRTSPEELRRSNESFMRQLAGQAAVELAAATNPPFMAEQGAPIKGYRKRVEKDHQRVHRGINDLYGWLVNTQGQATADMYWAILRQKGIQAAITTMIARGVAMPSMSVFSKEHIESQRENGAVPNNPTVYYVDENGLARAKEYSDHKQANVGLTKAGWIAAAAKITRSRAGGKAVAWLRKLARKSSGSVRENFGPHGLEITLTNDIPWSQEAMNPVLSSGIELKIEDRLARQMYTQLRAMAKKMSSNQAA